MAVLALLRDGTIATPEAMATQLGVSVAIMGLLFAELEAGNYISRVVVQ